MSKTISARRLSSPSRARRWLDDNGHGDISLIVTGGFRTGADAVALATAAMIAIGCQQYRACSSNNCPVGIATQRRDLRERFDVESSAQRLVNFFEAVREQMSEFARMCGKRRLRDLGYDDLASTNYEISHHTPVPHV